ncbi:CPBP family intramembrane metalloprotease [Brevibacterium sp. BRM-1]|uniref:CPBP family intramembrane glutamic endopeptidase n=1 Tax=Brevibacterium sp. BRM-1 TaxID=2999062 RepID=UPI0022827CE4|nr:CPBP family intramembrane glutamic endopeptidase [Brevibacterium sp. BRM-1]WAL39109.1 CPBP family intramembrane metalloprotease [Brevibacterium sp. BRM-1]
MELVLVAALSLGQSAVYAAVRLADVLSRGPLSQAQSKLNTSQSPRPWFDLVYQLLDIGFALVPVGLVLYLMSLDRTLPGPVRGREAGRGSRAESSVVPRAGARAEARREPSSSPATAAAAGAQPPVLAAPCARMGFDLRRPWGDLWRGAVLFLVIGVGTLGVYAAGRALGLTAQVQPANLGSYWWTVTVLLLAAVKNGILEEVLLLGFGADRLARLGARPWLIVVGLAVFRGSYHLYQGIGPFAGNVAMGLLFGWLFLRGRCGEACGTGDGRAPRGFGRVMPFVLAHTLIDAVGFLAPGILAAIDPR